MPGSNFMESSPFLLLFLLGYCLALIEGDLRCYCNESGCVSTGYMCKSSVGQCFTSVEIRGDTTHQIHGCLDSLPREHQSSCKVGMDVISASKASLASGNTPFLLCCTDHMCNYREDIDISIILTPKYNGTFQRGSSIANDDYAVYSKNHHSNTDGDRELWFKAAVIAVPIAGGFILVLLVLLAVRMLRTDTRHHRRLIHIRREHSLTKAHMYISDHFKSNKQQFSLFSGKPGLKSPPTYTGKVTAGSGSSYMNNCHCTSTCFTDSTSSCCNHPLHSDSSKPADAHSAIHMSSHCHAPLSCSSNHRHPSYMACSVSHDSHGETTANCPRPCSFFVDSPTSRTSNKDINDRTDTGCHTVPHTVSVLDSNRTHCERDYKGSPFIPWGTSSLEGPIADV